LRRCIEPGEKRRVGFRRNRENGAFQQCFFGGASCGIKHEVRPRLPEAPRSTIDQAAYFWLDAQVERFARGRA
jgi:hypothetical protein